MSVEMTFREHLEELRGRVLRILLSVMIITIFCMTIGVKPLYSKDGTLIFFYPYPDVFHNFAIQVTSQMTKALLPPEVSLIQTAPGQAFFAQLYVSGLIGMIGSIPVIAKETYGFISPAFRKQTKRSATINVLLPTVSLFIAGILFSYFVTIPLTIDFLYKYGLSMGVATFLNINDFISFVLQFFLGFGIAFELPIIMYVISLTEFIEPKFWRKNFRYAILVLVVIGALITPDGSGITMWFVAGPMIALYLMGMLAVERRSLGKTRISVRA
jgi:sec-independent protein translocase protein TatC